MFLVSLGIYFLPTILAAFRKHPNALAIFLIDLLLGWTVLGWIGAMVWAFIMPGAPVAISGSSALETARTRYARGEIKADEFEEIKKNLGA
jgi:uncharacterized membrane protein